MSTRASILYSNKFHIYDELLEDAIYFEFNDGGVEFTCRLMGSNELSGELRELFRKWGEELRTRAAELRDGADGELAGKAPNHLSTEDK